MHTIVLLVNNHSALKTLQSLATEKSISILDEAETSSPAMPGAALSLKEFKDWIATAEQTPSVSFDDAKQLWAHKRKYLQQLTK